MQVFVRIKTMLIGLKQFFNLWCKKVVKSEKKRSCTPGAGDGEEGARLFEVYTVHENAMNCFQLDAFVFHT